MIERLDITGVHLNVFPRLEKYVRKKIGNLDRLMPRHAKKSVHGRVVLRETKAKKKMFLCEVVLELPGQTIMAKESTINIFSAVDIVEAKLARQIRKYKTTHGQDNNRRSLRRLLRRPWRH